MGRSVASATNVRRGASVVRSAGRAKKEAGDVARAQQQRAALHEKWAALQAEANSKLAALQAKAPGAGLQMTSVQLTPRKADTDVGTLTLIWLPFRRDAAGNAVYSGAINVDGRRYTLTPADFAPTAADSRHLMHGLSLKGDGDGPWSFELAASAYDYDRDLTRSPTVALPDAAGGGSGRIGNQNGTGWSALALRFAPGALARSTSSLPGARSSILLGPRPRGWISGSAPDASPRWRSIFPRRTRCGCSTRPERSSRPG